MLFNSNPLRVTQLENLLAEKERLIAELVIEKKSIVKIQRDQEKQIGLLQNDRDYNTRVENQQNLWECLISVCS